jgi:hypothetical protein
MAIFSASAVKKFFQCSGKKFSVQWGKIFSAVEKRLDFCLEALFFNNPRLLRNNPALFENKRALLDDKRNLRGKMFVGRPIHTYIYVDWTTDENPPKKWAEKGSFE